MKRLLGYNPTSGITDYYVKNDDEKGFKIVEIQDCQNIVDFNKAMQNEVTQNIKGSEHWFHFARIPVTILDKWCKEDGIDIRTVDGLKAVEKKLRDPDYKYLRTSNKI